MIIESANEFMLEQPRTVCACMLVIIYDQESMCQVTTTQGNCTFGDSIPMPQTDIRS